MKIHIPLQVKYRDASYSDLAGYPANQNAGYWLSGRVFCSKFICNPKYEINKTKTVLF
jgi:hypothetical protein